MTERRDPNAIRIERTARMMIGTLFGAPAGLVGSLFFVLRPDMTLPELVSELTGGAIVGALVGVLIGAASVRTHTR